MDGASPCSRQKLPQAENSPISGLAEDPQAFLGFPPPGDDPAAHFSSLRRAEISLNEPDFGNRVSGTDGLEIVITLEREECANGYHNELLGSLDGVEISVCLGNRDTAGAEVVAGSERGEAITEDGVVNGRIPLAIHDSFLVNRDDEIAIDKIPESENAASENVENISVMDEGLVAEKKRPREVVEEMCKSSKRKQILDGTEEIDEAVKKISREGVEVREYQIGEREENIRVCTDTVETARSNAQMDAHESLFQSPGKLGDIDEDARDIDAENKRRKEKGSTEDLSPHLAPDQVDNSRQVKPKLEELPSGGFRGADDASDPQVLPGVQSDADCMDEAVCTIEHTIENDAGASRVRHRKRRKIAMLLAYCGAGYQGMQKNPGAVTIEGELEEALVKAEAIPETYDGNPRKVDWMRAARTDKGVSAVGQVVSGSFYIDPPGFVERVNTHLPKQIRLLGYKRVTPTFNAKKYCDRRRYEYVIPIFALDPNAHRDRETVLASEGKEGAFAKCQECSERGRKIPGAVGKGWVKSTPEGVESAMENAKLEKEETKNSDKGKISEMKENILINKTIDEDFSSGVATIEAAQEITIEKFVPAAPDAVEIQDREEILPEKQIHNCIVRVEETDVLPSQEPCASSESQKRDRFDLQSGFTGQENVKSFHFGEAEQTRLNKILNHFVGTHNFHNYTTRMKAEDPSAKRYIVSFETSGVFTIGTTEFVKCVVVGQSFMLHQIRKMIGMAIAVFRGCAPESMLHTALRRDVHINVPTAPELGLFLDECMYPAYNQKWYKTHEEVSQKGLEKEISSFKHDIIYQHIAALEQKEGLMALFLHSLNDRNYPDFVTDRESEKVRGNQLTDNECALN